MGKCWPIFSRIQAFINRFRVQSTFGYSASHTIVLKASSNSYSVFQINSVGAMDLLIRKLGQYGGTDARRVIFCTCSAGLFLCIWNDSAIDSTGGELSIALSFRMHKNNRAEIGGLRSPQIAKCLIWEKCGHFKIFCKAYRPIFDYRAHFGYSIGSAIAS